MKTTLVSIAAFAALALSKPLMADDYSVFHVCQDHHVIHTADGAEAGHVEYIVVDPSSRAIVSTVVTGGIVGEKYVAVPFESMTFNEGPEIRLTEITREKIVSAPVIERTQITTNAVVHPDIFQRTSEHFGVRFDASIGLRGRDHDRHDGNFRDNEHRDGRVENTNDRRPGAGGAPTRRDEERDNNGREPNNRTADASRRDGRNDPGDPATASNRRNPGESKEDAARNKAETTASKANAESRKARMNNPDAPPAGRATSENGEAHGTGQRNGNDGENKAGVQKKQQGDTIGAAEKARKNADETPAGRANAEGSAENPAERNHPATSAGTNASKENNSSEGAKGQARKAAGESEERSAHAATHGSQHEKTSGPEESGKKVSPKTEKGEGETKRNQHQEQ